MRDLLLLSRDRDVQLHFEEDKEDVNQSFNTCLPESVNQFMREYCVCCFGFTI